MKTTVKDFILDNMTDLHFERLVNLLLIEQVQTFVHSMEDTISEYVSKQENSYTKNNTFEIVNHIKKISDRYTYYDILSTDEEVGIIHLNDSSAFEQIKMNRIKKVSGDVEKETHKKKPVIKTPKVSVTTSTDNHLELELDFFDGDDELPFHIDPEISNGTKEEVYDFHNIKFAFLSKNDQVHERNDIDINDLNMTNYQEYVAQQKKKIAWGLSSFIYEILHYKSEYNFKKDFEPFLHEESLVKLEKECEYGYGYEYYVYFFLENRTRYISEETQRIYSEKMQSFYNDDWGFVADIRINVEEPRFVECFELQEDIFASDDHMLEPFIYYLKEEMTIPEVSEEGLYGILEQFIHILTFLGYTVEKQIEEIRYIDKYYDKRWV